MGPATEESVRALRASQAFISGNGFTADRGLSRASGKPSYVYVTKHRLSRPDPGGTAPDGGATNDRTCGSSVNATDLVSVLTQQCQGLLFTSEIDAHGHVFGEKRDRDRLS